MKKIKRMNIFGFKKFKKFSIEFNDDVNIIIGDNESGKSTLLDAINITVNQKYKNYDKYIIKELLNIDLIKEFKENPKIDNLPSIIIDIELQLDDIPSNSNFYGMTHSFEKNQMMYGIRFSCKILEDMIDELMPIIKLGQLPYEYYQMSWNTFQGEPYNAIRRPVNLLFIDNDDIESGSSYNYYNKSLFNNNHDNKLKSQIKNEFREKINGIFKQLPIKDVNDHQTFGINEKKIIFENILTIFDDNIPIENKGKGKENIIKTKIALDKNVGKTDVLAIEEPENHLSFNNLKQMINEIRVQEGKQMIITTHESMIANSLNLMNILWIKNERAESLRNIKEEDADFFYKNSNNNMLQFILSNKVILVEGPTEFLLIPKIFEKTYNRKLEDEGITVIDCGGIKYKRFEDIAKKMNKTVAVLTDNDNKQSNLNLRKDYNKKSTNIKIFMDDSLENWTWEACFYNLNKEKLDLLVDAKESRDYKYHGKDYGNKTLGKMLNNKVEIAYKMYNSEFDYAIPKYIKDCLEWIRE